jgi:toxin ParE1/3/4
MKLFYSARARKHLKSLEIYLAERFYPRNAELFIIRLPAACEKLTRAPHQGTKRDDLRPGVRSIGFEQTAVIYFELIDDGVLVLSILYRGKTPKRSDLGIGPLRKS